MSSPYLVQAGRDDCEHGDVGLSVLTVYPPIQQWTCRSCGRVVRQVQEIPKIVMPPVPETPRKKNG